MTNLELVSKENHQVQRRMKMKKSKEVMLTSFANFQKRRSRPTYSNPRNEGKLSPGKNTTSNQGYPNRYETIFVGCCFHCKNFGYQAKHCKAHKDYTSRYKINYQNKSRRLKEQGQIKTFNSSNLWLSMI